MTEQGPVAVDGDSADGGVQNENVAEDVLEADFERNYDFQQPKVLVDPGEPTAREKALHDLLHMPFQTWCYDCLQGQGKDRYHLRLEEEDGVARIAMDYMFLTERGVTRNSAEADEWAKG